VPEDSTWWVGEYGLGFGTRLKAAYERQRRELEQEIRTVYEGNAKRGWASPKVLRYSDPEAVNAPLDRFLNCMNQIVPLYQTTFQGGDVVAISDLSTGKRVGPTAGNLDGYYVYDRGGFRFVPLEILMKLPSERPIRIQLDMAVMESKLIEKVPIRVPPEAIQKHIGGRATVEVALGLKGETQSIKPVEGDPILTGAVIEAVKHWRFGPTTLDGDPVEVSVRVSVTFDMR
jgi:TonB family protein